MKLYKNFNSFLENKINYYLEPETIYNIRDIFIPLSDYDIIDYKEQYYNTGSWWEDCDLSKVTNNKAGISFYISTPLKSFNKREIFTEEIKEDLIQATKRTIDEIDHKRHGININIREFSESIITNRSLDYDMDAKDVENILNKDIYSFCLTIYSV